MIRLLVHPRHWGGAVIGAAQHLKKSAGAPIATMVAGRLVQWGDERTAPAVATPTPKAVKVLAKSAAPAQAVKASPVATTAKAPGIKRVPVLFRITKKPRPAAKPAPLRKALNLSTLLGEMDRARWVDKARADGTLVEWSV